jgi:hypothetical protein
MISDRRRRRLLVYYFQITLRSPATMDIEYDGYDVHRETEKTANEGNEEN